MKISEIPDNESAIETMFCKPFSDLPQLEISRENFEIMANLLMTEEAVIGTDKELTELFAYKLINKRVEHCFDYTLDEKIKVMIISLTEGNAGKMVMYLTYLQYCAFKRKLNYITLTDFFEIFRNGFPCDADMHQLWVKCKVEPIQEKGEIIPTSDNLIDYAHCLKSIRFTNPNKN